MNIKINIEKRSFIANRNKINIVWPILYYKIKKQNPVEK